jgi:tetratricopeptide (TPR) repeat protein
MTSRTTSVLRIVNIALVAAIVVALGAVVVRVIGTDPASPKTELERASFAAEEAVRANPEDAASRIKLAAAYLERDNAAAAVEQAEIGIRLDPNNPTGYYMLGLAQTALGRTDEAIQTLTRAVETEGQVAQFYQDAWLALSRAHEQAGNDDEALRAMSLAVSNGPENVVLLFERGRLYERFENWEGAMEDYAAALEYVPDYEPAADAFERLKTEHPDVFEKLQEFYEGTSTEPSSAVDQ